MTLYIEYVLLDNMIVDYLILSLVGVATKCKLKKICKITSSTVGTIFAVFLPYLMFNKIIIIIYKLACGTLMILLLKRYKSIKNFLWNFTLLLMFTFLFGGMLIALLGIIGIEYSTTGILLYNSNIPISVFILLIYFIYLILKRVIKDLNKQLKFNNFTYKIKLIDNNEIVEGVGYFDSGNMICKNGQAVCIMSSEMFFKLYQNYPLEKLVLKKIDHETLKDASYIEIKSLSKAKKYLSFKIDKMIVEDREYRDVYMAVTLNKFDNFDLIINSKMVGEKV